MDLVDIVATPIVWMAGGVLVGQQARRLPQRLATWAYVGYAAHLVAGLSQVVLTRDYFGGGDMFRYALEGGWVAEAVNRSPQALLPEAVKLAFQQEAHLPIHVTGAGSNTGSMVALSGLLLLITGGSLHATIAAIATSAYLGKLLLYRALRQRIPESSKGLLLACLLLPSAVFWSSGLLKESIAIGPTCAIAAILLRTRKWLSWRGALIVVLAVPIALVKTYILFALVIAASVVVYLERAGRRGTIAIKPWYLILGSSVAAGALVVLGRIFPEYAFDNLGESLAQLQVDGQRNPGGSNYFFATGQERSLAGQLGYAPIAIATSLFRPFFFEFHNAASFVAAAESSVISLLALRAMIKRRWRELLQSILNSPVLAFCAAFTLAFGLGVGLGTTNMGTLSRYRVPLMPFWATLLIIWNADLFDRKTAPRSPAGHAASRDMVTSKRRLRGRRAAEADA